jgi:rare lipoprotein A
MDRLNKIILPHYFWLTVLSLFLLAFLSGCSSTHVKKKDGPPNYHVDETKVPNAVPKIEPLSKRGNMESYQVFGKRYYTMKSSKNYDEVGIASWYGTQFHDRLTSNGERYDLAAMTAAHKTLPLPTYVEVTNLKNNRKIIVKVNDRGPFAESRIIDLSYVAAKKLDMLGHGTAHVRVRAIDPRTHNQSIMLAERSPGSSHSKSSKSNNGQVYLQVGAFSNKASAERLKQSLSTSLKTPVHIASPSDKSRFYRVRVGPIKDMATANRITHKLKGMGIDSNKLYFSV